MFEKTKYGRGRQYKAPGGCKYKGNQFTCSSPQTSQHVHKQNVSRLLTRCLSWYRMEVGEEAVWGKVQNSTFSIEQSLRLGRGGES